MQGLMKLDLKKENYDSDGLERVSGMKMYLCVDILKQNSRKI